MTKLEIQAEALDRARNGQALTNFPAIIGGFMAKGIPEADIKPRENVFTFNAWKALGRSVKKGEHGIKVLTFIDCSAKTDQEADESAKRSYRRPWTTTVFHVSQTEPTSERKPQSDTARADYRTPRRSAWASGHGRYPSVDPGPRLQDPGELAADQWAAKHCPSDNR